RQHPGGSGGRRAGVDQLQAGRAQWRRYARGERWVQRVIALVCRESSQVVLLETSRPAGGLWRPNRQRRGRRIDGTSLGNATRGGAPASGAGSMQNWVGETREVRGNAPEVAHRAQEEAALLDDRFDRVGVGEAVGGGGTAQEAHAQCGGGRFKLTKLSLTRGQSLRVPGLRLQEDGQCQPQALEELAVHGGNCVELFDRERSAALDTPHCKLDQTVGDDVGDMLEVDHGRQNILSPRALPLVVEGLLVADVGEI